MALPSGIISFGVSDYVAVGSLALNVMVAVIGATWGIGKINAKVGETFRMELESHKDDTTKALEVLTKQISDHELATERNIGETGAALREKVSQVELFIRDNYVRQDIFNDVVRLMTTNVQAQFDRLDQSIAKLSDKFDRLIESKRLG